MQHIEKTTDAISATLRQCIKACWQGKCIGGTLGMPFEGGDGPFDLDYYTPVPTKMEANDDLDLQLVWLYILDKMENPRVSRHDLAKAWIDHIGWSMCEYGVAKRNLREGMKPPVTGSFDNWFKNGMGAAIRSEIWACLSPGKPEIAAAYAYEDACVDHAEDGVWAEMFLAALQSAAFVEPDQKTLLKIALNQIDSKSKLYQAVMNTCNWYESCGQWQLVRENILEEYDSEDFSYVVMNICFIVLGWLAGKGDFGRTICITANCGKDTDCTAASVGALMGIISPDCITDEWLKPIGERLIISPEIKGVDIPDDLDDLTEIVLSLQRRLNFRMPPEDNHDSEPKLHFEIDAWFTDWNIFRVSRTRMAAQNMPENAFKLSLPGTHVKMMFDKFKDKAVMLKYKFKLTKAGEVRVVFNSHQQNRVWLNGKFIFGRDGGKMFPSPHSVPLNQSDVVHLEKGIHEILAVVARPEENKFAEWMIGIADAETNEWIPNVFCARNDRPSSF